MKKALYLFLILNSFNLFSKSYTLSDCINYAQKNSTASVVAKSSFESKELAYKGFLADFFPQVVLSGSAPGLVREINEITLPDGNRVFEPQSLMSGSGFLSLQQKISLTGGSIYLQSGLSRIDMLEGTGSTLWKTTPVQIRFDQPLFAYNDMKWNRRIEELMFKKSQSEFAEDMEQIAIDVTSKFFDLYLSEMNIKNVELNVAINDTLYTLSTGRYKVGKIAENDLLQSELALLNAQNELEQAKLTYRRVLEEFKILVGFDTQEKITIEPPQDYYILNIVPEKAIREALDNRSALTDYKIQEVEADSRIARARSQMGFSANMSATFGLNQTAGDFDEAYMELLDQETANLTFQIPLFRWNKGKIDLQSAKLSKKSIQSRIELNMEFLKTEIKYQVLQFNQQAERLPLTAKADTIAQKRFEVAKNRYMISKIDLNTLFIAQNEKNSAFRGYINALKTYWVSYYSLRKLTLYDFLKDEKIIY
jgi:outer membrane protein TolC